MINNLENKKVDFLQSKEWREFQESVGRRTFFVEDEDSASSAGKFSASIIEHKLPLVGKYFYIPKGPIIKLDSSISLGMTKVIAIAKENNAGWIRVDSENDEVLKLIKKNTEYKISKAPHDMQPKEIFVIDITKTEEELLTEMKPKTRYNVNLAKKKGVKVFQTKEKKYVEEFLRLVKAIESRKGIKFHPAEYYKKMLEVVPENMLGLYVAEYNGKVIAANLVVFYGNTTVYLHGATDDEYRNVMAPYLLQWKAIEDAKLMGYKWYDFGGVKIQDTNSWAGITKFKLGFSPSTQPIEFPGSYDIIINPFRYWLYRIIQKIKICIN